MVLLLIEMSFRYLITKRLVPLRKTVESAMDVSYMQSTFVFKYIVGNSCPKVLESVTSHTCTPRS